MTLDALPPFAAFLFLFVAALAGGMAPLALPTLRARLGLGLSFSAGILVSACFMQLIPETFEHLNPRQAGIAILLGYLSLFVLEKFVLVHPCEEESCAAHPIGIPAFIGISLHTLVDGIALGASLEIPRVGWVVFLALLFHKLPSAFSLSTILLAARYPIGRIRLLILAFATTLPLGGFLAYLGLAQFGPNFLGWALGVSAGTFLAISTSDLFVQVHSTERNRFATLFFLLAGAMVSVVAALSYSHG